MFDNIKSDIKRYEKLRTMLLSLGGWSVIMYRLSRFLHLHGLDFFGQVVQLVNHIVTGAELSRKSDIGPGLRILHPTAILIGPGIKIGANASICQNVTVSPNVNGPATPRIGEWLWASAGAAIYGGVILGDHVWVGPNTVVLKDIPSDRTVFCGAGRIFPKDYHFEKQP